MLQAVKAKFFTDRQSRQKWGRVVHVDKRGWPRPVVCSLRFSRLPPPPPPLYISLQLYYWSQDFNARWRSSTGFKSKFEPSLDLGFVYLSTYIKEGKKKKRKEKRRWLLTILNFFSSLFSSAFSLLFSLHFCSSRFYALLHCCNLSGNFLFLLLFLFLVSQRLLCCRISASCWDALAFMAKKEKEIIMRNRITSSSFHFFFLLVSKRVSVFRTERFLRLCLLNFECR